MSAHRPSLEASLTGTELLRWYWLKSELTLIARRLGVSAGGSKKELTARVVAALDSTALPDRQPRRLPSGGQLTGPLSVDTVLPPGQRSSQVLRGFFLEHIGPGFRFDSVMRSFIGAGTGATLGAAVQHWHRTRARMAHEIAPQFEFNRFLRAWHSEHSGASHGDALEAWRLHRALPIEDRSMASEE